MDPNTRLLTQSNSRLAKADIIKLLTDEEAWSSLPEDQQRTLYALLPKPDDPQQPAPDHTVHPLKTEFAPYIKHFLIEWQNDLKDGRNTLKWRTEARIASGERAAGVFDHVLAKEREDKWGSVQNVNVPEEKVMDKGPDKPAENGADAAKGGGMEDDKGFDAAEKEAEEKGKGKKESDVIMD